MQKPFNRRHLLREREHSSALPATESIGIVAFVLVGCGFVLRAAAQNGVFLASGLA